MSQRNKTYKPLYDKAWVNQTASSLIPPPAHLRESISQPVAPPSNNHHDNNTAEFSTVVSPAFEDKSEESLNVHESAQEVPTAEKIQSIQSRCMQSQQDRIENEKGEEINTHLTRLKWLTLKQRSLRYKTGWQLCREEAGHLGQQIQNLQKLGEFDRGQQQALVRQVKERKGKEVQAYYKEQLNKLSRQLSAQTEALSQERTNSVKQINRQRQKNSQLEQQLASLQQQLKQANFKLKQLEEQGRQDADLALSELWEKYGASQQSIESLRHDHDQEIEKRVQLERQNHEKKEQISQLLQQLQKVKEDSQAQNERIRVEQQPSQKQKIQELRESQLKIEGLQNTIKENTKTINFLQSRLSTTSLVTDQLKQTLTAYQQKLEQLTKKIRQDKDLQEMRNQDNKSSQKSLQTNAHQQKEQLKQRLRNLENKCGELEDKLYKEKGNSQDLIDSAVKESENQHRRELGLLLKQVSRSYQLFESSQHQHEQQIKAIVEESQKVIKQYDEQIGSVEAELETARKLVSLQHQELIQFEAVFEDQLERTAQKEAELAVVKVQSGIHKRNAEYLQVRLKQRQQQWKDEILLLRKALCDQFQNKMGTLRDEMEQDNMKLAGAHISQIVPLKEQRRLQIKLSQIVQNVTQLQGSFELNRTREEFQSLAHEISYLRNKNKQQSELIFHLRREAKKVELLEKDKQYMAGKMQLYKGEVLKKDSTLKVIISSLDQQKLPYDDFGSSQHEHSEELIDLARWFFQLLNRNKKKLQQKTASLEKLEAQNSQLREQSQSLTAKCNSFTEERNRFQEQLKLRVELKLRQALEKQNNAKDSVHAIQKKIRQVTQQMESQASVVKKLEQKHTKSKKSLELVETKRQDAEMNVEALQFELETLNEQIEVAREEKEKLVERQKQMNEDKKSKESEILAEMQQLIADNDALRDRNQELRCQAEKLQSLQTDNIGIEGSLKVQLERMIELKESAEARIRQESNKVSFMNSQIQEKDLKIKELTSEKATLEEQLKQSQLSHKNHESKIEASQKIEQSKPISKTCDSIELEKVKKVLESTEEENYRLKIKVEDLEKDIEQITQFRNKAEKTALFNQSSIQFSRHESGRSINLFNGSPILAKSFEIDFVVNELEKASRRKLTQTSLFFKTFESNRKAEMGTVFKKQDLISNFWLFLMKLESGTVGIGLFAGQQLGRQTALLLDVTGQNAIPQKEGLGSKVMPVHIDLSGSLLFGHSHIKVKHCSLIVSESLKFFQEYNAKEIFGADSKVQVREFEAYRVETE